MKHSSSPHPASDDRNDPSPAPAGDIWAFFSRDEAVTGREASRRPCRWRPQEREVYVCRAGRRPFPFTRESPGLPCVRPLSSPHAYDVRELEFLALRNWSLVILPLVPVIGTRHTLW